MEVSEPSNPKDRQVLQDALNPFDTLVDDVLDHRNDWMMEYTKDDLFTEEFQEDQQLTAVQAKARKGVLDAIAMLPTEKKGAYEFAVESNPFVVEKETPIERFLLVKNYNFWDAAVQLCDFWNLRRNVLGKDRYWLPMRISPNSPEETALTPRAIEGIQTGMMTVLPPDDKGRPVYFWDRRLQGNLLLDRDELAQISFYILHVLGEMDLTLSNGFVAIILPDFESPDVPRGSPTLPSRCMTSVTKSSALVFDPGLPFSPEEVHQLHISSLNGSNANSNNDHRSIHSFQIWLQQSFFGQMKAWNFLRTHLNIHDVADIAEARQVLLKAGISPDLHLPKRFGGTQDPSIWLQGRVEWERKLYKDDILLASTVCMMEDEDSNPMSSVFSDLSGSSIEKSTAPPQTPKTAPTTAAATTQAQTVTTTTTTTCTASQSDGDPQQETLKNLPHSPLAMLQSENSGPDNMENHVPVTFATAGDDAPQETLAAATSTTSLSNVSEPDMLENFVAHTLTKPGNDVSPNVARAASSSPSTHVGHTDTDETPDFSGARADGIAKCSPDVKNRADMSAAIVSRPRRPRGPYGPRKIKEGDTEHLLDSLISQTEAHVISEEKKMKELRQEHQLLQAQLIRAHFVTAQYEHDYQNVVSYVETIFRKTAALFVTNQGANRDNHHGQISDMVQDVFQHFLHFQGRNPVLGQLRLKQQEEKMNALDDRQVHCALQDLTELLLILTKDILYKSFAEEPFEDCLSALPDDEDDGAELLMDNMIVSLKDKVSLLQQTNKRLKKDHDFLEASHVCATQTAAEFEEYKRQNLDAFAQSMATAVAALLSMKRNGGEDTEETPDGSSLHWQVMADRVLSKLLWWRAQSPPPRITLEMLSLATSL